MKKINTFLKTLNKIQVPDESLRKEFKKMVLKATFYDLKLSDIRIRNNVIYFSAPATVKNEIFLHKKEILNQINKKFHKKIKNLI